MSLIRLKEVGKRYERRQVLREVFFRLRAGERVGVIGPNGSGKTTLLKLILGREEPSEGTIERDADLRIGYFSQFSELDSKQSAYEVLLDVMADLRAMEEELLRIEAALNVVNPDPRTTKLLLRRQADLLELMEHHDGWTYENRIATALSKLGFRDEDRRRPIHELSGGWRNRAALAKILLEAPDILLLDEPTNFLDLNGTAWLENWLLEYRGGLLVVSHDRHFLDAVVTRIVELENYHLHEYAGDFSAYVREKQFRFKTLEHQFQYEEELLAFEAEALQDRREARRNPSAHLKRQLANIKKSVQPRPVEKIVTGLYQSLRVPEALLKVSGLAKSFGPGTPRLFSNLSFELRRGERLAVVGPNGCGKTTLLRILTQAESADAGQVDWLGSAECISFNHTLEQLDLNDSVTHAVNVVGLSFSAPQKQVNHFLELMQFSKMDLQKQMKIATLSGGQKARVALAQCLLSGAAVLLLDEPTNHLDLTSIRVMEQALVHFPGAVIVVSHDRFFIDRVATRLLIFEGSPHLRPVAGNWSTWQASQAR